MYEPEYYDGEWYGSKIYKGEKINYNDCSKVIFFNFRGTVVKLPPLKGSDKQITYGSYIRYKTLSDINKGLDTIKPFSEFDDYLATRVKDGIYVAAMRLNSAKWWIDHKSDKVEDMITALAEEGDIDMDEVFDDHENRDSNTYLLEKPYIRARKEKKFVFTDNITIEFPQLKGSDKQIDYGSYIRIEKIRDVSSFFINKVKPPFDTLSSKQLKDIESCIAKAVEKIDTAKWWIERKSEKLINLAIELAELGGFDIEAAIEENMAEAEALEEETK